MPNPHQTANTGLRIFTKITSFATLFLIFAGAMVKSTESGLAVPDWPLSYGMFFPPMVGGVFYEHGHRMIASCVGIFILILAIWLKWKEPRGWVRILGYAALAAVIIQGLLGGITVLFFLPTPISVAHGTLAQLLFLLTIFIAYTQSKERFNRLNENTPVNSHFIKVLCVWTGLILIQLIVGAVMRHTQSGLAIPDFPTMGGQWLPKFNNAMLATINDWRFMNNMDPVETIQVVYHFVHRLLALLIFGFFCYVNYCGFQTFGHHRIIRKNLIWLNYLIAIQISLGILTVLSQKSPQITSYHVVTGAALFGMSFLLLLRVSPLTIQKFKECLQSQ